MFRDRLWPAALVCSVIANVNRDEEKRSEPFSAADFMPGAEAKSEQDDLHAFAEAVLRGETFDDPDPADLAVFKRQLNSTYNNLI